MIVDMWQHQVTGMVPSQHRSGHVLSDRRKVRAHTWNVFGCIDAPMQPAWSKDSSWGHQPQPTSTSWCPELQSGTAAHRCRSSQARPPRRACTAS